MEEDFELLNIMPLQQLPVKKGPPPLVMMRTLPDWETFFETYKKKALSEVMDLSDLDEEYPLDLEKVGDILVPWNFVEKEKMRYFEEPYAYNISGWDFMPRIDRPVFTLSASLKRMSLYYKEITLLDLCSTREVKRIGKKSAVRRLPQELIAMVGKVLGVGNF